MTSPKPEKIVSTGESRLAPGSDRLAELPWWMFAAIGLGLYIIYYITANEDATGAFWFLVGTKPADVQEFGLAGIAFQGIAVTIFVCFIAYILAITIGITVGLGRVSKNKLIYNLSTFYVEIVRGIPMLVLLAYIAFALLPLAVDAVNSLGEWMMSSYGFGEALTAFTTRDVPNVWRGIIGLGIGYGAFSAEIVRAGIESIERGQWEAASALGMSRWLTMRHVVLPQALRRMLPAYGNDFVAMIKDSALVSVLGVRDMTQAARLHSASSFQFFMTYSILTFLYLVLTISLTRLVRYAERQGGSGESRSKHM
ncbi:MAG: polar amino acid transport system permease protein [Cellvibrionaceae bacterium]|jgi:polar amino acid transport system permease protein